MKRAFANKVDATAKGLIEETRDYGARYLPINGVIDGVIWFRGQVYLIDWKSAKTKLTEKQMELVKDGWPIWFLRDSQALRELLFGIPTDRKTSRGQGRTR